METIRNFILKLLGVDSNAASRLEAQNKGLRDQNRMLEQFIKDQEEEIAELTEAIERMEELT